MTSGVQGALTYGNPGSFVWVGCPLSIILLWLGLGTEQAFPGQAKAGADSLPRVAFCLCQNGGHTMASFTVPHHLPGSILQPSLAATYGSIQGPMAWGQRLLQASAPLEDWNSVVWVCRPVT